MLLLYFGGLRRRVLQVGQRLHDRTGCPAKGGRTALLLSTKTRERRNDVSDLWAESSPNCAQSAFDRRPESPQTLNREPRREELLFLGVEALTARRIHVSAA